MIDFEEELKNFELSMEVEEAEDAIHHRDLKDVTDVLKEMMEQQQSARRPLLNQ